jgi:hypothetical protein
MYMTATRKRKSAKSPKSPKKDYTIKGKAIEGIFYYEDENNPNMLKQPDWKSEEGVPTQYGRVHSLNEFFKKYYECEAKPYKDPCRESIFPKPSKKEKTYGNEYIGKYLFITREQFFDRYKDQIWNRYFDDIPN